MASGICLKFAYDGTSSRYHAAVMCTRYSVPSSELHQSVAYAFLTVDSCTNSIGCPAATAAQSEAILHVKRVTHAGKRKQKQPQYVSEGKLADVMSSLMDAPAQRSATPTPTPTPTAASPSPSQTPSRPQTPTRQPIPSPSSLSPLGRSPGGSRPVLDPFEPLFTVVDDEDAKALEEIEGVIQLILDVTPRRRGQVRWHKSESAEVRVQAGTA